MATVLPYHPPHTILHAPHHAANNLTETPSSLASLTRLECLALANNHLTTTPALPESSAFKRLYLSQNKIRCFDTSTSLLGVPELTELTIAVNRLAEVGHIP